MTLGRRLVITNTAFIAAIALVGGASLWGMLSMRGDIRGLMYEHQELRLIDEASIRVAEAMGLLRDQVPDRAYLMEKLSEAIDKVRRLLAMQAQEVHANPEHGRREASLIEDSLTALQSLQMHVQNPADVLPEWDQQTGLSKAGAILDSLSALAAETHAEVVSGRREANATIRWTIWVSLTVCLALMIAAILLGLAQYRVVTRPLHRLRAGVRRVADGKFDQALATEGDGEFVELAVDFNRMSRELQALYKNLEEKVAQRSRELVRSERLASVGFLAAGVAHEINNPLGIISTYAELSLRDMEAMRDAPSVIEVRQALKVMHEEAFRCKGIIEKMLSLSRSSDEGRTQVHIRRCVEDIAAMVTRLPRFFNRKVTLALDELAGVTVLGNESEIKQVMLNLIVNALEAVDAGGHVRIEGQATQDLTELRVIDDGCGMVPEVLEHVFEPFFTRKQGNGEHGSGLGLSICHAIVESHRGRIVAQSEGPGRGSRFTVQLPRNASQLTEREFEVTHE
jgi:signal transduction histidine kinase